jgi:hypothetical protein
MEIKRLTVNLSKETHNKVKIKATENGVTISDAMRRLISLWLNDKVSIAPQDEPRKTAP